MDFKLALVAVVEDFPSGKRPEIHVVRLKLYHESFLKVGKELTTYLFYQSIKENEQTHVNMPVH